MCVCLLGRTISWYALAYSLPRIPNNPFSFPALAGQKILFSSLILKQKRLFQRKKCFLPKDIAKRLRRICAGLPAFLGSRKGGEGSSSALDAANSFSPSVLLANIPRNMTRTRGGPISRNYPTIQRSRGLLFCLRMHPVPIQPPPSAAAKFSRTITVCLQQPKGGIQWAAKQPTNPKILCVFKRASGARSHITMDNRKSIAATHCEWASFFRFSFQARMGHG